VPAENSKWANPVGKGPVPAQRKLLRRAHQSSGGLPWPFPGGTAGHRSITRATCRYFFRNSSGSFATLTAKE
jgi:hypothetical protein